LSRSHSLSFRQASGPTQSTSIFRPSSIQASPAVPRTAFAPDQEAICCCLLTSREKISVALPR